MTMPRWSAKSRTPTQQSRPKGRTPAGEDHARPIFRFKARDTLDLGTTYDVTDADGQQIGCFKKEFRKSLTRSTWRMNIPALDLESVGTERTGPIGFIRRLWNLVLEDVPGPWRFHFDFRTPTAPSSCRPTGARRCAMSTTPASLRAPERRGGKPIAGCE